MPAGKSQAIIFRQGPRTLTEADKARRRDEVTAWARVQNAAGHKLEPRILAPDVLRPGADTDHGTGVAADAWPITALLFLEARDLAETAKVAETHPANHFGASVEVRPWATPAVPAAPPPAPVPWPPIAPVAARNPSSAKMGFMARAMHLV